MNRLIFVRLIFAYEPFDICAFAIWAFDIRVPGWGGALCCEMIHEACP